MIFKYSEFKGFIEHMKCMGKIVPLAQWDYSNAIVLRHDVDFDVDAAYRLAKIEEKCGVRSTFFFLTTCHTYNLFSAKNRATLLEMTKLGFEIGLHFDPTIYGEISIGEMSHFVDQEARLLSFITGEAIESISLHNPSVHGQYPLFEGYRNAYDKKIFSDEFYLSDSQMNFRGKNPYLFIEKVKEGPIQVLLHPLHYSEEGLGYPHAVYKYLVGCTAEIDNIFQVNSAYKKANIRDFVLTQITSKNKQ